MQQTLSKISFLAELQSRRRSGYGAILCILGIVLVLLSLHLGPAGVAIYQLFFPSSISQTELVVLLEIRLPRVMMTMITGAGLAISGAVLQSLFKNPLADPGIVGVSSGAALFGAFGIFLLSAFNLTELPFIAFFFELQGAFFASIFVPFMALLGAGIAMALLFFISGGANINTTSLILAGVAINAACATLLGLLIFIVDDATLRQITFWSMGSYAGISMKVFYIAFFVVAAASLFLWRQKRALMLMSLSDKQAKYQGIDTEKTRQNTLLCVAAIVAVCVSFTGIVGFVGLVVPHICRMLISSHLKVLLPFSALIGALLVTVADTTARTIIAPAELPVGLVTSLIGVPFFILLLKQQRNRSINV